MRFWQIYPSNCNKKLGRKNSGKISGRNTNREKFPYKIREETFGRYPWKFSRGIDVAMIGETYLIFLQDLLERTSGKFQGQLLKFLKKVLRKTYGRSSRNNWNNLEGISRRILKKTLEKKNLWEKFRRCFWKCYRNAFALVGLVQAITRQAQCPVSNGLCDVCNNCLPVWGCSEGNWRCCTLNVRNS